LSGKGRQFRFGEPPLPGNILNLPRQLTHKTKVQSFDRVGDFTLTNQTNAGGNNVFNTFCRLTIFVAFFCLCSCERLSGPESRELAGGYRIKRVRGSTDFALIIPNESGGLIIDEIGWRKPLIIARGAGSRTWEVINTSRAEHTRVSDEKLKSDPELKSVEVVAAEKAWTTLNPTTRIW
jgi:hypothetical protein